MLLPGILSKHCLCAGSNSLLSAGSWGAAHGSLQLTERRVSYEMARADEDGSLENLILYERGMPSDVFTLILQGKALIRTGEGQIQQIFDECPC